jgi:hypothetical protein
MKFSKEDENKLFDLQKTIFLIVINKTRFYFIAKITIKMTIN